MAPLRFFLTLSLLSAFTVSAELFGAQPDGGLYITPDVLNSCKTLQSTAADNSGNGMLQDATGGITNVKEQGTGLGDCCPPPYKGTPVAFTPFDKSKPLRVRRSWLDVQNDPVYMAQLAKGFALMRSLNGDDKNPNSLKRQARVHCLHCTTAKVQGYIHTGAHFLPWHRAQIYHMELTMGYLLNDPTFAMPYWEWENPDNTWIIPAYLDSSSPLYDAKRTQNTTGSIAMVNRYCSPEQVYKAIVQTNDPYLFLGLNNPTVSDVGNAGTMESEHNWIHVAVGAQAEYAPGLDPVLFPGTGTCPTCRFHDMGSLSTAAWDPVFWSHHFNVDRLWTEWLKQPNPNTASGHNENLDSPAWLNSVYTFYRYDGVMEYFTIRDLVDTTNLGYTYAPAANIWNATNAAASGVAGRVAAAETPGAAPSPAAAPIPKSIPGAGTRKLLGGEFPPALTVAQLLAQYPGKSYQVDDITGNMPEPIPIGRAVSHWRLQRTPPLVPGTQELIIFKNITARLDERAIVEVWINKPDVTVNTPLNWHYAGALSQIPLSPNAVGVSTQLFSTSKNRPLQINVDLYNLGLLKATELLITLVPVEVFVDSENNAFRAAPQFTTLTLGGAEIHQGPLMDYFQ